MRSATIATFAGIANAAMISYAPPAPVESTVYETIVNTITSCGAEVTNCPADSTVVSSTVIPMTTSTIYETRVNTVYQCPEGTVDCPYESGSVVYETETIAVSTTVCPVGEATPTPGNEGEESYPPVSPPTKSHGVPEESGSYPSPPEESEGSEQPYPSGGEAPYPPKPTGSSPLPTAPGEQEETCPTVSVKTIVYSTEVTTVIPTVLTKYETATLEVPCPEPTGTTPTDVPVPPPSYPVGGNSTVPSVPSGTPPVEANGAAGLSGSVLVAALAGLAAFAFA